MEMLVTVRGSGTTSTHAKLTRGQTPVMVNGPGFRAPRVEADLVWMHVYGEHPHFPDALKRYLEDCTRIHTTLRHPRLIALTGRSRHKRTKRRLDWVLADLPVWVEIFDTWDLPPITYHPIPWGGASAEKAADHPELDDLIDPKVWAFYEKKLREVTGSPPEAVRGAGGERSPLEESVYP